ncbi:class I SAM-dependent methyltransferase [Lapillicoccus jejuensis]|uniref:Methyltransferase family protein n=1 Tax=Lapillicoccus jejuensis TaxID=402171 RepID=A0A542DZG6_9MICO|nr:class I SAM-dependent methyltransferase [Lapillicoccus jejuensis]TQJ08477.1 methyltransferase family protein [Lapillicoccus jejuensis]
MSARERETVVADPAAAYDALWRARAAALADEFVGQESFLPRTELLGLARRAGVGPGTRVLDVCCGTGGPGLVLVTELGGDYLGVDASPVSVARARVATVERGCGTARFVVGTVPPLPPGPYDVVLLLETLLAFRDRATLLRSVAGALAPGGRFVVTAEVGRPLTGDERRRLPPGEAVWVTPLATLLTDLERAGLVPVSVQETTARHAEVVEALLRAYEELAARPAAAPGVLVARHLVTTHRRWSRWLHTGRVHTVAIVAEARPRRRPDTGNPTS